VGTMVRYDDLRVVKIVESINSQTFIIGKSDLKYNNSIRFKIKLYKHFNN